MANHQITHIRKPDVNSSLEHITHVKYDGIVHTREEVIRLIDNRTDAFYVSVPAGTAWVEVVRPAGRSAYIKTKPDSTGKDNLLSLPQC